ncbi:MAG: RNA polymerase sigma factor [Planctomycetota bacterium]|jgi:RNA polymerase sigma-70 factor (ECF subfamily)
MSDWTPDVAKLQAHDDAEWLAVERHYCGRLQAYAQRRAGELQAAEDIVQETLLGAVRGIPDFDPKYSFEQYLFGICRNRTIDHLRRRKARAMQVGEDEDGVPGLDAMVRESETPSAIVRGQELSTRARDLMGTILRDWVEETWSAGEYTRLMVIESLFFGGWRNRDSWRYFQLRDETAVAGIKFRALKRLRQLAAVRESGSDLLPLLAAAEEGHRLLDMDVQDLWRERRVSCPARGWIARHLAKDLEPGPDAFVHFHLEVMECPFCVANKDDLAQPEAEFKPFLERTGALTELRSAGGEESDASAPA